VRSLRSFWHAVQAFVDALGNIAWHALLIALLLHLLNLTLRTRGWRNILQAAFPESNVRWRWVFGSYLAGVGINAFAPARGGDVVKVYAIRQRVAKSNFPTIVSSLGAETIFDFCVASLLLTWAYATGRLPIMPDVPDVPAFEWGWFTHHQRLAEVIAVALLLGVALGLRFVAHHVARFWERVRQGLAILRTPRIFIRRVVVYQALGWVCRLGTAYYMLEAFHVHATITNALLVLVVGSLSTMLPITPGGAGAQQAMVVIVLTGAASRSTLLAYSVGAQAAVTALNVVLGLLAIFALFGHIRPGRIRDHARRAEEGDETQQPAPRAHRGRGPAPAPEAPPR
jgi:uncharacterized membrane protein YbhN (UPF0104 family)